MGEKVVAGAFDLSDRQRYRDKLQKCLKGLERLLEEKRFDRPRNLMGLEIELNLAGADGLPRMLNGQVLERIASRDFRDRTRHVQPGGQHNPAPAGRAGIRSTCRRESVPRWHMLDRKAEEVDAGIVMIGFCRRWSRDDLVSSNLSDVDRYTLLNDQIVAARGEDFTLDIEGVEHLVDRPVHHARGRRTSVQLHLQVTPGRSPTYGTRRRRRRPRR
ncbi:Glutamate--cysteine ligase OS=Streptomyces glaucescens OX=1907 GN=SGLAU_05445 PE=4 SV=1 [Streptomyces glaucescens]